MSEGETRYIGDVLFDELEKVPGFIDAARKLIAADWRTGTESFRDHTEPMVSKVLEGEPFESWGDLDYGYLARRAMGNIDPQREPWLWAYAQLVFAHIAPDVAREALNRIKRGGQA